MSNSLSNWRADEFGTKLVQHLKTRTMPVLPHIGVLGPEPEDDEFIDSIDDEHADSIGQTISNNIEDYDIDWNFVPNKLKYQLTTKPTSKEITETKVDFYIRIKDGCDADLGNELLEQGRPSRYILSPNDILKVFKHFEIFIYTQKEIPYSVCKLFIDGIEKEIQSSDYKFNNNRTDITIRSESEPFLAYERGNPKIIRQTYKILITKEVESTNDGHQVIKVSVINKSKKTTNSTLPRIAKGESEEECRKKYKNLAMKKSKDLGNDDLWDKWFPNLYKVEGASNNPEGNRYGYLMELYVSEKIASSEYPIDQKDMAQIINCVFDDKDLKNINGIFEGEIIFQDHTFFMEEVPKMVSGASPLITLKRLEMNEHLALTLKNDMKYESLYKFQEDAIEKIMGTRKSNKNTVLISARTAGGKTEAFLLPIINFCINTNELGVKGIIFYPTKALANDQASRFIKILYHLNKRIEKKITMGILHGDIPTKTDSEKFDLTDREGLPFECPRCDIGLLRPVDSEILLCDKCKEEIDFVWAHSRSQTYAHPPDILITNPDILIWDLMLRPAHHSIFGRPIIICKNCGMTYSNNEGKIKCGSKDGCGSKDLEKITPTSPSFLVFDEIHLFKGSFGSNCSYFLSRIEKTIKHYASKYHKNDTHRITKIGSTATISNEKEFIEKFFNVGKNDYWIIPNDKEKLNEYYLLGESDRSFKRYHVFVMPYAFTSDSTIGMAIQYIQSLAKHGKPPTRMEPLTKKYDEYLQILTFVNSIKASNSLISQTRRTVAGQLPDLQIDGHTTDFDKSQRSKVERKFNLHDLHVVFATSTLEVGVDFRSVHCVLINGFPYSFNDYIQRIGRGGRKNDSLIITVCQNWKPVDHYYYYHGKNILKNPHLNIEPVPITRENSEVIKKHIQGALLDYITRNTDDSEYNLDDVTTFKVLDNHRNIINEEVLDACGIRGTPEEPIDYLGEFIHILTDMAKNTIHGGRAKLFYPSRFSEEINPKYNLTKLRSTEPEVMVEVFWNK